jgi:hypothetical protein
MAGEQLHARKGYSHGWERGRSNKQQAEPGADSTQPASDKVGRLLQGVVVAVASQGLLPQEGHQLAKLERSNASSKLQHCRTPTYLPPSPSTHLILNAAIDCSKIGVFCYTCINPYRTCFWIESPHSTLYWMHSFFQDWNIWLYPYNGYAFA